MSLAILFHLLWAQHVSDINISIFRILRLCWWITTSVVLFSVSCVLEIWCGCYLVVFFLQAQPAKRTRARPWHASELFSFLVGLRTYQHSGSYSPEPQARGSPLFGCQQVLKQYIPELHSVPEASLLHPQPEEAPCRVDADRTLRGTRICGETNYCLKIYFKVGMKQCPLPRARHREGMYDKSTVKRLRVALVIVLSQMW